MLEADIASPMMESISCHTIMVVLPDHQMLEADTVERIPPVFHLSHTATAVLLDHQTLEADIVA